MGNDDTDERRVPGDNGDADDREGLPAIEPDSTVRTAVSTEEVDQRIVDLLSWILDTETRAKIYVHLLANPGSTSEEVARGTGLYPSTVREALAELHEEARVTREKRSSEGAGNNPYEYTAIQPSELVGGVVDQVQRELNTIFTLDRVFDREDDPVTLEDDVEPVTIVVNETGDVEDDSDDDVDEYDDAEGRDGDGNVESADGESKEVSDSSASHDDLEDVANDEDDDV